MRRKNVIFFTVWKFASLFCLFRQLAPLNGALLEKLIAALSHILNAPKGSLWYSQAPTTDPCPVKYPIYTLASVCGFALYLVIWTVQFHN